MVNFIALRQGPIVREDAILLALALEQAGHTLTVRGGSLEVSPRVTNSAHRHALAQAAVVRHVVALLDYGLTAPEPLA